MPWWLTCVLVAVGILVLDKFFLWLESRGWLFYRKKKPTGGGSAMLGVAAELFQPAQYSAIQEQEEQTRHVEQKEDEAPIRGEDSRLSDDI